MILSNTIKHTIDRRKALLNFYVFQYVLKIHKRNQHKALVSLELHFAETQGDKINNFLILEYEEINISSCITAKQWLIKLIFKYQNLNLIFENHYLSEDVIPLVEKHFEEENSKIKVSAF